MKAVFTTTQRVEAEPRWRPAPHRRADRQDPEDSRLSAGGDPVAFINANPGRVKSYHLKDWSPDPEKGYKVLLGEGSGAWPQILEAAETVGGVDYYLIEQEGSRFSPLETAKRCLENLRKTRGEV
jgi:sugar phosphate isomerase/epimerase